MFKVAIRAGVIGMLVFCVVALAGCLMREFELTYDSNQGWHWQEVPEDRRSTRDEDQKWIKDRTEHYVKRGKDPKKAARLATEDFFHAKCRFPE